MSDKAYAARKAFGQRLKELRLDAHLNGRQLAALSGLHNTKISRIESARQNPSEDDIRAWATACGAEDQIPELIAIHREAEQMWMELKRQLRAGQKQMQARGLAEYAETGLLRAFESTNIHGILQTHAYARAMMMISAEFYGLSTDDAEAAADARVARQKLVTEPTGKNRYHFILEAGALDIVFGGVEEMAEQLDFLMAVTRLPHVALGIIPARRPRTSFSGEGFYIFDDRLVRSEYWTSTMQSRRPDEIATYVRIFDKLRDQAVYGDRARGLIRASKIHLQTPENF